MLSISKVANRVRRRSMVAGQPMDKTQIPAEWLAPRKTVDRAPDLLRWSPIQLEEVFPSVAFGGYAKYYKTRTTDDFSHPPSYRPVLCQQVSADYASPAARDPPPTSLPLFCSPPALASSSKINVPQLLPPVSIVCDNDMLDEPMTSLPRRPRYLSNASTSSALSATSDTSALSDAPPSPRSLRRKKAQLLRSPSIERGFTVDIRQLFTSASTSSSAPANSMQTKGGAEKTPLQVGRQCGEIVADIIVQEEKTSVGTIINRNASTGSGSSSSVLSRSFSQDSSDSEPVSDDSHFDFKLVVDTPGTSVAGDSDSGDESLQVPKSKDPVDDLRARLAEEKQIQLHLQMLQQRRPDSRASFRTARSNFSDRDD